MATIIPLKTQGALEPRRQQFRRDVDDLLQMLLSIKEHELGGTVPRSALFPIELEKLIPLLGFRLDEINELGGVRVGSPWAESDIQVPGMLDRRERVIVVARNQPVVERRYTIAHELAHLLYHNSPRHLRERVARLSKREAGLAGSLDHKREEREAEIFGAELLMPEGSCD